MISMTLIFKTLLVAIATILLNFVLGVLISIKKHEFDINLLPKFIATDLFPYIGGLMVLALLSVYLAELEYLYYAAVSMVAVKFSKEALLDKIKVLILK